MVKLKLTKLDPTKSFAQIFFPNIPKRKVKNIKVEFFEDQLFPRQFSKKRRKLKGG